MTCEFLAQFNRNIGGAQRGNEAVAQAVKAPGRYVAPGFTSRLPQCASGKLGFFIMRRKAMLARFFLRFPN